MNAERGTARNGSVLSVLNSGFRLGIAVGIQQRQSTVPSGFGGADDSLAPRSARCAGTSPSPSHRTRRQEILATEHCRCCVLTTIPSLKPEFSPLSTEQFSEYWAVPRPYCRFPTHNVAFAEPTANCNTTTASRTSSLPLQSASPFGNSALREGICAPISPS